MSSLSLLEQMIGSQEDRISRTEDKVSELSQQSVTHNMRFEMIMSQLEDIKSVFKGKTEEMCGQLNDIQNTLETQSRSIQNMHQSGCAKGCSIVEAERLKSKRRQIKMAKLLWLIPGAAVTELIHQFIRHFWK